MRRENLPQTSSDDACSSQHSPNYMKATTSSSARKGTVPASTGRLHSGSRRTRTKKNTESKTGLISVEECSDNAGVNIPVEIKSGKISSSRQTRKLLRSKSVRIRARYCQFSEGSFNEAENSGDQTPEFDEGMEGTNGYDDENSRVRKGSKQKGMVERSRSIKLTRLRSIRSSKRRQKSRFGLEMSPSQPRYMKDTGSQEARKNSAKGLTRTSSLRPLRIPSLRPRRNKVKKRSEFNVDRATCSSTLKSSKMPDHIELESEGISSYHVCPYSYCSLNAHHHRVPSMPIKEFISARRQMIDNQKGKRLEDGGNISGNDEIDNEVVMDEDGVDYFVRVYAKPRKKWSVEALNCSVNDRIHIGDGDWTETEILCETSVSESESCQMFSPDDKTEGQNREIIASNSTLELLDGGTNSEPVNERVEKFTSEESGEFVSSDSEASSENNLIDILSDNQKYSSIWHLIYQQLVSSESSMVGNSGVGEQESDVDGKRKYDGLGEDRGVAVEKDELDQNDVIEMVHEALNVILKREEESRMDVSEEKLRESDEVLEQKSKTNEEEITPGGKMSKSIGKFRKLIATTKLIVAMERMKRISPRKPRFLSLASSTEEERVYLRHLSMKERKNSEEWLLDYALRKVISRFSPDEQKRVGLLIEAFETVNPEHKDKGIKFKNETGDKDSRACDEINSLNSVDAAFEESNMGKEETMTTLEVQPQLPSQDTEVHVSGDMNTFLIDERKYRSMWGLIYQHVRSDETSINTEKEVNESNERKQSDREIKDLDSTHNSTSNHHDDDDDDNQSTAGEKPELNQSAAIKLVREAIDAILQRYEHSSDQREGVEKHTFLQSNPELHRIEKPSEELQREVEPDESKTPQKKFSSSFQKLRKAVVSAKFIKAMEKMKKITVQKPRYLNEEAVSVKERVYLRHLSMDGRRNEEEWMLDYALRQVISKLAPGQKRRVERLVEAFETVTPEQKDRSIRFYPLKSELVANPRGRLVSDEVTGKKDGVLECRIGTNRIQRDDWDYQESDADDTAEAVNEPKTEHEIDTSKVITSQMEQDSESGIATDMITVLSDKDKYKSMWQLIYQHVTLNEVFSGVDENDDEYEKKYRNPDCPESHKMEDKSNQSEVCDEKELDQSDVIKLVKEAINAILQSHEHISNRQSEKDCGVEKRSEMDIITEKGNDLAALDQVESIEVKTCKRSIPMSTSKLKKLIVTTKFINAIERLRRGTPRNWSSEATSEGERVKLRAQTTNQKRSAEEWMLDYALRKVISSLAPHQQRKVALLIGAFEAVTLDQKVERKDETDSNLMIESLQRSYSSEVSKEERDTNAANDGLLSGAKKHNTMWHLIYQHLGSVTSPETGDKQGESVANEDHVDADNVENDANSVASELTESDAVKLLKDAIINIIDKPQDVDDESFSNNTTHASKEDQRGEDSVREEPEKSLTRGYSKLRKLILCKKFISAIKKRRKSNSQKHKMMEFDSNGAVEKAHLKRSVLGEKRISDAWMLDHALQKAIAELKPVQQRRVALLVKAFEKVNPELEGVNKGSCCNRTNSANGDDEEKEDSTFELSDKSSETKDGCDLKVEITSDEYTMVKQECRNESDGCEDIDETPRADTEVVVERSQPEYVEDVWNGGTDTSISSDKESYSSLWGLLVKHINTDVSENSGNEKSLEIDVKDEKDEGDDMEARTPNSTSFEFQEKEAIKLVQEALHDILPPDNPSDDQLMKTSSISFREACNKTVNDTSMIPQKDESLSKESSLDIRSSLSKVILCKRFVKAMDKMRKLKQQQSSPPNHVQQHHSNAESLKSMRNVKSSDKKSWEEWMLDHAMQQVVGKLAPVQKKKVSLLVQAFESVSSKPKPVPYRAKIGEEH